MQITLTNGTIWQDGADTGKTLQQWADAKDAAYADLGASHAADKQAAVVAANAAAATAAAAAKAASDKALADAQAKAASDLAAANAAFLVMYQAGSIIGPFAAGVAMTVSPVTGFVAIMTALMVICTTAVIVLEKRERRRAGRG